MIWSKLDTLHRWLSFLLVMVISNHRNFFVNTYERNLIICMQNHVIFRGFFKTLVYFKVYKSNRVNSMIIMYHIRLYLPFNYGAFVSPKEYH